MDFNGGMIIGCDAGTLNPSKIKGSHCALQSGILAAEYIHKILKKKYVILMIYLKVALSIKSFTSQETLVQQCTSLAFIWVLHITL